MPIYTQVTNGSRYLAIRLTLTPLAHTPEDIANNRTRVEYKYELYETRDYGSHYAYSDLYAHLDLDGVRVGRWMVQWDFRPAGANAKTIASGVRNIQHNEDGTKTLAFLAKFNDPNVSSGVGVATISGNLVLPPIIKERVAIGQANGVPIVGEVYIGNTSGLPIKATEVWIGDADGVPRKSIT